MLLLFGALVLGFAVARFKLLPSFLEDKMKTIGTAALCLLLFSMGVSMGSNREIIAALPTLGFKAFILAVAIIAGSTLLVWAALKLTAKKASVGRHRRDLSR